MADTAEQKGVKKKVAQLFRNINKRKTFTDSAYQAINEQADEVVNLIYAEIDSKWGK